MVSLVSMSPWCRASCAKKFAQRRKNDPKMAFHGVLGELFRGNAAGGGVLGELFRANRYCAGLGCSAAHFRLAAVGVLQHEELAAGVSPACHTPNDAIPPEWWQCDRACGWRSAQSADHLGEKR